MAAAAVTTDAGQTGGKRPEPPSLERLAAAFPQLEVIQFIGQGGMGAVYKARQKQLDRVVALKVLPPGIGGDPSFAERFTREAKALAKLLHPNIVALFEFGQADGIYYLLMEFVDGVSLGQLLRSSRVSAREALAIVPQICDALQYAHDQGIVHRDIKPENILLDRRGRVKVADFGLAKLVESNAPLTPSLSSSDGERVAVRPGEGKTPVLTDAGKVMGTPAYMAPEQLEHPADVDHRADIYALGVVFYQMLTGELPGKSLEPPSRKVLIDVRLDEVVMRALEKNPELRYQQVSEVKTMVETIAGTPDPSTGRGEEAHTAVAKPRQDWLTWSPLQSQEVGEICAHLTKAERNHYSVLGLLFAVWIVGTCFGIPAFIRSDLGAGKWIVAAVWVILFAVSIPMLQRMGRHFLCSTTWARERGFRPEHLRLFSFSRGNLWKVCAVLAVGLGLIFALDKAFTSYLGLGSSPQPNQIQERHPNKAAPTPQRLAHVIHRNANTAGFGPVIERTVVLSEPERDLFLSFVTGELMKEPGGRLNTPEPEKLHVADEVLTWARSSGADVLIRFCVGKTGPNNLLDVPQLSLKSLDMAMFPTNTEAWDRLSARDVVTAVRSAPRHDWWQGLAAWGAQEHTFLFRTRQGNAGILLVTGYTDNPRSVKLCYKLVLPQRDEGK
jgi:serine/threonine protein kinase